MAEPSILREYVKTTIRAERVRRNVTFQQLSNLLRERGIYQTATNLSTKVARGGMSAQLFVAILKVLGNEQLDLDGLKLPKTIAAKSKSKKRFTSKLR